MGPPRRHDQVATLSMDWEEQEEDCLAPVHYHNSEDQELCWDDDNGEWDCYYQYHQEDDQVESNQNIDTVQQLKHSVMNIASQKELATTNMAQASSPEADPKLKLPYAVKSEESASTDLCIAAKSGTASRQGAPAGQPVQMVSAVTNIGTEEQPTDADEGDEMRSADQLTEASNRSSQPSQTPDIMLQDTAIADPLMNAKTFEEPETKMQCLKQPHSTDTTYQEETADQIKKNRKCFATTDVRSNSGSNGNDIVMPTTSTTGQPMDIMQSPEHPETTCHPELVSVNTGHSVQTSPVNLTEPSMKAVGSTDNHADSKGSILPRMKGVVPPAPAVAKIGTSVP